MDADEPYVLTLVATTVHNLDCPMRSAHGWDVTNIFLYMSHSKIKFGEDNKIGLTSAIKKTLIQLKTFFSKALAF